ncbi:precorrin-6A/cobalt-precorrin-6A reductase [Roseivivax sp. CAU 1753]
MDAKGKTGVVTGSAEARALLAVWPGAVALRPRDLSVAALRARGIGVLVDAAHPFDTASHVAAWRVAEASGADRLLLCREGHRQRPGDRWLRVRSVAMAAQLIPAGARVFATTGAEDLPALRLLHGRLFIRRRHDRPGLCPLRHGTYLRGAGPFSVAQEMRLMARLGIDWLIARDAGGEGAYPKLEAARRLGVRVALVARPALPPGPRVRSAEEAVSWLISTGPRAGS